VAMGVGAGGSMVLRQPSRCRPPLGGHELLRQPIAETDDARIALYSVVASTASASVGSWARNSSSSESSSSSPCGGGGRGGGGGGAPEPPRGAWRRL
jgi:hypothetical protein